MKKIFTMILCCSLILSVAVSGMALAADSKAVSKNVQTVSAQERPDFTIIIDSTERTFYNVLGEEVQPILYNGTTYLPVRAIGELMKKNVNWSQSTLTVTLGGERTTAQVAGSPDNDAVVQNVSAQLRADFTIVIDNQKRSFADVNGNTVYPILFEGSTYLPIRAIGQIMGKNVDWDADKKMVKLGGDALVTDADSFENDNSPQTGNTNNDSNTNGLITAEKAKEIALKHAGLSESDVNFVKVKLDTDDFIKEYEVEFYTDSYAEYDYEINATTGAIISVDKDAENYVKPGNPQNPGTTLITAEKAKEIALAKVSGATAANIRELKLDRDDNRYEYEGKIIINAMEYEFEIDAYNGKVLSWEVESIYD